MKPKQNNRLLIIIVGIFGYFLLLFIGLHVSTVMMQDPDLNLLDAIGKGANHSISSPFEIMLTSNFLSSIGILTLGYVFFIAWSIFEQEKNSRTIPGKENGSAGWNNDLAEYNKKYSDPPNSKEHNGPNNMILTHDVFLNMNSKQTRRNNNILVVGGSGAGKSRFLVKPNILQSNCNYIITDPAGELLSTTGQFLEEQGYEIKIFNLVEMAKSDCYNPFHYIRDDLGVLMMINCLITNTNPGGKSGGDPFWEKSETALLQALCFYLIKYCPKHQQNFTSVMKLLRAAEVDENDSTKKSNLDRLFDEVAVKDPNSIALKQYLTFKMGAGKTLKSILISCSVRLTVFNMKQIENLTKVDTLDLGSMGEGKKALFVIIPAADSTYNFLVSMMYSQLFETLYFTAETKYADKRLETPVRFLLDEFANIGQIPDFTKKLATMRKYEISCTVILQNLAQLKTMYKDDWESIVGNCDSFLYLGGQEYSTLEYLSKELGDATIVVRNNSRSIGRSGSHSLSYNRSARKLMNPDEIMRMADDECILLIRGLKPFYGKKYDYTKHPNYKYTGDADDSKLFINDKNNAPVSTFEERQKKYEEANAMKYAKMSHEAKKKNEPVAKPVSMSTVVSSLGIKSINDIPSKISSVSPEEIREVRRSKPKSAKPQHPNNNSNGYSNHRNEDSRNENNRNKNNNNRNGYNNYNHTNIKDNKGNKDNNSHKYHNNNSNIDYKEKNESNKKDNFYKNNKPTIETKKSLDENIKAETIKKEIIEEENIDKNNFEQIEIPDEIPENAYENNETFDASDVDEEGEIWDFETT